MFVLLAAAACAQPTASEGGGDPDAGDAGNNGGDTTPQPDTDNDVGPEDTGGEDPDTTNCGTCCPGETRCVNELTLETCAASGNTWEATTCEDSTCVDGACDGPPIICEAGESRCLNAQTQQTCNSDGTALTTIGCGEGVCIGGLCRDGAITGEACEADGDCAGGECLCRGDESCTGVLATAIGAGYCTNADCTVDRCAPGELCVDFSLSGVLTGGNHCFADCSSCGVNGFGCRAVPTRMNDRLVWTDACIPDYPASIGDFCNVGQDCLGGTCWRGGEFPSNGYCTMPECGEGVGCPSGSSCIDFEGMGPHCLRHCGNGEPNSGPCPAGLGIDVSCQFLTEVTTDDLKWICAPRIE